MISESRGIEKRSISGLSRLSIEIPTFVKWKFGIYLFRSSRDCPITYLLPCCGKPCESIRSRKRIPYGARVIHTLYYHTIIIISPFIIRTPQIIVLSVHLRMDIELMRVTDVLLNLISIQSFVLESILCIRREASLIRITNTITTFSSALRTGQASVFGSVSSGEIKFISNVKSIALSPFSTPVVQDNPADNVYVIEPILNVRIPEAGKNILPPCLLGLL